MAGVSEPGLGVSAESYGTERQPFSYYFGGDGQAHSEKGTPDFLLVSTVCATYF